MENTRPLEIKVQGTSMSPYLIKGDLLSIDLQKLPNQGDICLFRDPNNKEFIVHRYLGEGFYKGDNSPLIDSQDNVVLGVLDSVNGKRLVRITFLNKIKVFLSRRYLLQKNKFMRVSWKASLWAINWITRRCCI